MTKRGHDDLVIHNAPIVSYESRITAEIDRYRTTLRAPVNLSDPASLEMAASHMRRILATKITPDAGMIRTLHCELVLIATTAKDMGKGSTLLTPREEI
jgi:hypothetical protein